MQIASQTFTHLQHSSPRMSDYIFTYAKAISSRDEFYSYLYILSLLVFVVFVYLLALNSILWQDSSILLKG